MKRITAVILIMLCMLCTACGGKGQGDFTTGNSMTCTLSVECAQALKNKNKMSPEQAAYLPDDGVILKETSVEFEKGNSVYDVLEKTLKKENILMEASFTGDSAYIEGIDNLYEFDCGDLSGWSYCVNGAYPQAGCSSYTVQDGDRIEWHYTCDMGRDLGQKLEGEEK